MRTKVMTSLITLGGVLLAAFPLFRRRARVTGWRRIALLVQPLLSMMGRGGTLKRMVWRKVRA